SDHAARGSHRRPGLTGRAARALWARQHGRGLSRHRPRARRCESCVTRQRTRGRKSVVAMIATAASNSCNRILALVERHAYLLLKSWPRLLSMAYYPTVTMILWGFVTVYLRPTSNFLADAPGLFIGAVLLWDILFRGQLGVSLTFFEEMY